MRLTELVHKYLSAQIQPGDHTLDATSGNGHDTLHMAKLVTSTGHVIAIDIQETAIAATRIRLEASNCLKQVELLLDNHSRALQSLCPDQAQKFSAITFNLGYLPGGNKHIRTKPETTVSALDSARKLLKPDGLLLVTAYRGHPGGQIEADFVARWMQHLPPHDWQLKTHDPPIGNNKGCQPPILWVARKLYNTKNNKKTDFDSRPLPGFAFQLCRTSRLSYKERKESFFKATTNTSQKLSELCGFVRITASF